MSDSLQPHGLYSPWNSPGQNTGVGSLSLPQGSSELRDQTQVLHIAADSLLAEPPRKPKNTGVGSPSLLQRIVPPQEWNRGLLHCRQILYQLGYQGSPISDNIKTRFHLNSIKCYGRKQVSYMCRSSFNTMTITDF